MFWFHINSGRQCIYGIEAIVYIKTYTLSEFISDRNDVLRRPPDGRIKTHRIVAEGRTFRDDLLINIRNAYFPAVRGATFLRLRLVRFHHI